MVDTLEQKLDSFLYEATRKKNIRRFCARVSTNMARDSMVDHGGNVASKIRKTPLKQYICNAPHWHCYSFDFNCDIMLTMMARRRTKSIKNGALFHHLCIYDGYERKFNEKFAFHIHIRGSTLQWLERCNNQGAHQTMGGANNALYIC